jgi:hypothetical protein
MAKKTPAAYQATLQKLRKAAAKSGGTRQAKERAKKALKAHTRSRSSFYGPAKKGSLNYAVGRLAKDVKRDVKRAGRGLKKALSPAKKKTTKKKKTQPDPRYGTDRLRHHGSQDQTPKKKPTPPSGKTATTREQRTEARKKRTKSTIAAMRKVAADKKKKVTKKK